MQKVIKYLNEMYFLLGDEKRKLPWMMLLFLTISFLELASVGLIAPYVAIIIDPSLINNNQVLVWMQARGFPSHYRDVLIGLGIILVIVFFVKTGTAILVNKVIFNFAFSQESRLRGLLMEAYLDMPYAEYLKHNKSEYIQSTQVHTAQYANSLNTLTRIVSEAIIGVIIIALLAWTEIEALGILVLLLSIIVFFYDLLFRHKARNIGILGNKNNIRAIRGINEGLDGLKEIRILAKEKYFHDVVLESSRNYANYRCQARVLSSAPKYMFELVLVTFVVILVIGTFLLGRDIILLIPVLSVFGVAGLRLLPSANLLTGGLMELRSNRHAVSILGKELNNIYKKTTITENNISDKKINDKSKIKFLKLEVSTASYRYPNTHVWALQNVSLAIHRGETIGFVGTSGAGKTTLVDVLLGLLEPQKGQILYNGYNLEHQLHTWRNNVAYLPQDVFLIDESLRNNIALGVQEHEIDEDLMGKVIKQARLFDLVQQMPNGLGTIIGERGVRISGGQKQRVALARAFYHGREVLVMDEATSSLDKETEHEIVDEIKRLKGTITMIIIAHRLSTVEHCDRIYRLENGRIVEEGTFENVIQRTTVETYS
jgi:ATP-binding cassette, subfamily B, bacterial PglK